MLDKRQIWAIFLPEFKMGFNTVEITCNINNTFGPGTAKKHTVQWRFKKFCKGDKNLEDEEHSGWPLEVDNHQLRAIIKADPLTTTQEVAEEFNINHSMVIQHLKQIGKVKKLNKWVPHELTTNQKKSSFWTVIFSYSVQQQWTISQLDCGLPWKVDFIWHPVIQSAQWLDQEEAPKHFPKPNLHQKMLMVTDWWSAASLIHYSFLNPGKTIISEKQIDETHQKQQHLQPTLVNRKDSILLHNNALPHIIQPTLQKLNKTENKMVEE